MNENELKQLHSTLFYWNGSKSAHPLQNLPLKFSSPKSPMAASVYALITATSTSSPSETAAQSPISTVYAPKFVASRI